MQRFLVAWANIYWAGCCFKEDERCLFGKRISKCWKGLIGNFISRSWTTCFALLRTLFLHFDTILCGLLGKRPVHFLISLYDDGAAIRMLSNGHTGLGFILRIIIVTRGEVCFTAWLLVDGTGICFVMFVFYPWQWAPQPVLLVLLLGTLILEY